MIERLNRVVHLQIKLPWRRPLQSWVFDIVAAIPDSWKPMQFGEVSDERTCIRGTVSDRAALLQFAAERPDGFRFFGVLGEHEIDLWLMDDGTEIYVTTIDDLPCSSSVVEFASRLASLGVEYGSGHTSEEDDWRHTVVFTTGTERGSRVVRSIGNDHRRYVPGLCWLNMWSDRYLGERQIAPDEIAAKLGGRLWKSADCALLQLYDRPQDWRDHAAEVDRFLRDSPQFFSLARIDLPKAFPPGTTVQELGRLIAMLKAQWP